MKSTMRYFIFLCLLTLSSLQLLAQTTSTSKLRGKVAIKDNIVGGILVTIEGKNLGTLTDANGEFEIDVPIGTQTIMFRLNGMLRHHKQTEFVAGAKYYWDTKIGPKYNNAYLIQMKDEGREDELELTEVKVSVYSKITGTVGFDDLFLENVNVLIQETRSKPKRMRKVNSRCGRWKVLRL